MSLTVLQATTVGAIVPVELDSPEDYRVFEQLVAGPTEPEATFASLTLPMELRRQGFYAFCNDNGVMLELAPNPFAPQLGRARLLGDIVLFRADEDGETEGLSPEDVVYLVTYLTSTPTPESQQAADAEAEWLEDYPNGAVITFNSVEEWLGAVVGNPDGDDITREVR